MTHDELMSLDKALHAGVAGDTEAFDRAFAQITEGMPAWRVIVSSTGEPSYRVETPVVVSQARVFEAPDFEPLRNLMGLARIAGDRLSPPLLTKELAIRSRHPDVQVMACIELLVGDAAHKLLDAEGLAYGNSQMQAGRGDAGDIASAEVIRRHSLIRSRLHELLLAYPILMHPRLLWCWDDSDKPRRAKPGDHARVLPGRPLLHHFMAYTGLELPTAGNTFDDDTLARWARHPALVEAARKRLPAFPDAQADQMHGHLAIELNMGFHGGDLGWGITVAKVVSFLRLNRLGAQDTDGAGLFEQPLRLDALGVSLRQAFGQMIAGYELKDNSFYDPAAWEAEFAPLRRELSSIPRSVGGHPKALSRVLAPSVFHVFARHGFLNQIEATGNAAIRLAKLIEEFKDCGLYPDLQSSAKGVVAAFFNPKDQWKIDEAITAVKMDVDLAQRLLEVFVRFGVSPADLGSIIAPAIGDKTRPGYAVFRDAAAPMLAADSMGKIIAGAAPATTAAPAALRRRAL